MRLSAGIRCLDFFCNTLKEGIDIQDSMSHPGGIDFAIRAKVDDDHASDTVTRRSRTGFIVCLNSLLIYWCSKK